MANNDMKAKKKPRFFKASSIGAWLVALIFFSPIAWIASSALKPTNDVLKIPPTFFFKPTFQNIIDSLQKVNIGKYFLNSVIYSSLSVTLGLLISFMAAYSFSRYKPAGTDFIMFLLLSTRFVPAAAFVVPLFQLFNLVKLQDSFLGLILFYTMFSIPFSVWILKGFIDGVSTKFDETGYVYGASRLHVMFKVVLPQLRPGLVAAFVFNIIFVWNEFLFNFQLGGLNTYGVPVGLYTSITKDGSIDWSFVASLGTAYVIPLALAIYAFQKYLLVGLTFGTVRGEV